MLFKECKCDVATHFHSSTIEITIYCLIIVSYLLSPCSHFAFETAIGVNGVVWLRAGSAVEAIVIRNALLNAELLSRQQTVAMVDQLAKAAKKAATSESASKKS